MRTVRIPKQQLVEAITKNRNSHIDDYVKAANGYRDYMIVELNKAINRLKSGENIELRFDYDKPPHDHKDDYDAVLKMLEMSVDDVVEIHDNEFRQFVLDDWDWQRNWKLSNLKYITNR